MYRITIHRIEQETANEPSPPRIVNVDTLVYSQLLSALDVAEIIGLINKQPRVRGTRKKKEGGK
jgi:hypothetical protein